MHKVTANLRIYLTGYSALRPLSRAGDGTLRDEIGKGELVPPKIRDLISDLERSGFVNRGGKGSHRNFVHPKVAKPITISGSPGDDAKHYQVRAVRRALEESKS